MSTMIDIETLAKELHEAGREAVEKGATVAAEKFGEKATRFMGWNEISEQAREGRRIQARYLVDQGIFKALMYKIMDLFVKEATQARDEYGKSLSKMKEEAA